PSLSTPSSRWHPTQPRNRNISRPSLSVSAISVTIWRAWHCWQPASMFSLWCIGQSQYLLYPCAFSTLESAAPLPPWHGVQPNFSGSWIFSNSLLGWLVKTSSPPIDAFVNATGSRVPRWHDSQRSTRSTSFTWICRILISKSDDERCSEALVLLPAAA